MKFKEPDWQRRRLLALGIDTVPGVGQKGHRLAQAPVGENRKRRHAADSVIRYQQAFGGVVHHQMGRAGITRGNGIQQRQLARRAVNGESGHAAGLGGPGEKRVEFRLGQRAEGARGL